MKHYCACLMAALITVSCTHRHDDASDREYVHGPYRITMEHLHDSLSVLRLVTDGTPCDSLLLPYPVYRFDCGDLTGDGTPEICVGVEKPTRYRSLGRRIFIYHIVRRRYVRPLWMGSRVGLPLVDFHVCRDSLPACIHTRERRQDGAAVCNEYRLRGFGLQFVRSITDREREDTDTGKKK